MKNAATPAGLKPLQVLLIVFKNVWKYIVAKFLGCIRWKVSLYGQTRGIVSNSWFSKSK